MSLLRVKNKFCAMSKLKLVQTVESPKGLSGKICPRDLAWEIFQTIPEDFPLFVRLWASKTEEDAAQSCPICFSGETVGSDQLVYLPG